MGFESESVGASLIIEKAEGDLASHSSHSRGRDGRKRAAIATGENLGDENVNAGDVSRWLAI